MIVTHILSHNKFLSSKEHSLRKMNQCSLSSIEGEISHSGLSKIKGSLTQNKVRIYSRISYRNNSLTKEEVRTHSIPGSFLGQHPRGKSLTTKSTTPKTTNSIQSSGRAPFAP